MLLRRTHIPYVRASLGNAIASSCISLASSSHNFLEKICSRSRRRAPRVAEEAYPLRSFRGANGSRAFRVQRGVTLIDTIVGISLMLVVFLGIAAVFRLSVDVVSNNKARSGAIALADQRMEYIRSLAYSAIGTIGGVPSGLVPQSETVSLNGVTYTRRTIVEYVDDPKDGTGVSDGNNILADYKAVKVDVSWTSRYGGTRHVDLVTRVSPAAGLETNPCSSACGNLVITVFNASNQPVAGASVSITNPGASPAVNFSTFTNSNGTVTLIAAPAASGYSVVVSNGGYSSDQTYSGANSSRSPLTISNNLTTSATFQIDQLSTLAVTTLSYADGSEITNVPFSIHGAKTTYTTPVYKYSATLGGVGLATTTISNLEWDTYTMSVSSATGYDLASSCAPQPVYILPNSSTTTILYLAPHTTNSLQMQVSTIANGAYISGAMTTLSTNGFSATQVTNSCGQTFFSGLASGTYSISVTALGHTTYSASSLNVSGSTQYQALMN